MRQVYLKLASGEGAAGVRLGFAHQAGKALVGLLARQVVEAAVVSEHPRTVALGRGFGVVTPDDLPRMLRRLAHVACAAA